MIKTHAGQTLQQLTKMRKKKYNTEKNRNNNNKTNHDHYHYQSTYKTNRQGFFLGQKNKYKQISERFKF